MLEILKNFEQVAARFSPILLIGAGIVTIIVGLFIWLGGLGLRKALLAIVGLVSGGTIGYFIISQNVILAGISALVALLIIMIFQRVFVAMLCALLTTFFCFCILARSNLNEANVATIAGHNKVLHQSSTIGVSDSIEIIKTYIVNLAEEAKQIFTKMPIQNWIIMAVLALALLVVGFFLWQVAFALCCASLGTMLVFTGLILLLIYKGSAPISRVSDRASFYGLVFVAMVGFGTLVQLLLCLRYAREQVKAKQQNKDGQKQEVAKHSWRNK
jgi:hypothetical protein